MSREFEVIVYGASGFTGRLVAEYMGNTYGTSVSWAMAGRSEAKLAEVRDLIGVSADLPLVTADAANEDSLRDMVTMFLMAIFSRAYIADLLSLSALLPHPISFAS